MLNLVRWSAYAGFVLCSLPYAAVNAWGYRLSVLFVIIAMVSSHFHGIQTEQDSNE